MARRGWRTSRELAFLTSPRLRLSDSHISKGQKNRLYIKHLGRHVYPSEHSVEHNRGIEKIRLFRPPDITPKRCVNAIAAPRGEGKQAERGKAQRTAPCRIDSPH